MRTFFIAFCLCFTTSKALVAADAGGPPDGLTKYTVDYPLADRFCPPTRTTFYEVTRTLLTVRGKRFRQKPNGGYGLPVTLKVDGKNMLHVGADLGWHQVGEPVFAVANGVVRMSIGPDFAADKKRGDDPKRPDKPKPAGSQMPWGNFVVIEHKTKEEDFYTTMYGHLATKRFVKTGDIVKAGQPIGTIGRQHFRINGGYKPHLHFGIREGRIAENGVTLFHLVSRVGRVPVRIVAIEEEWVEVDVPAGVPDMLEVRLGPRKTTVKKRDQKYFLPARVLWGFQRHDFGLVGYALTTNGWRDPVAFLKEHQAHTRPAPFLPLTTKP